MLFFKKNFFNIILLSTQRGNLHKKNIKDIIQNEVDPPHSHPIFDKFIFDKVFIMLTSLPPLEFLTKIMTFYALNLHFLLSLLAFVWRFAPILASHMFLVINFVDGQTHRHMDGQTDTLAI